MKLKLLALSFALIIPATSVIAQPAWNDAWKTQPNQAQPVPQTVPAYRAKPSNAISLTKRWSPVARSQSMPTVPHPVYRPVHAMPNYDAYRQFQVETPSMVPPPVRPKASHQATFGKQSFRQVTQPSYGYTPKGNDAPLRAFAAQK